MPRSYSWIGITVHHKYQDLISGLKKPPLTIGPPLIVAVELEGGLSLNGHSGARGRSVSREVIVG